MGLTVHINTSGLVPWKAYVSKAADRAARRAGSSALTAMRASAVRQIRERKNIKAGALRSAFRLSTPRSEKGALVWAIGVGIVPMPVSAFPHRMVRKGVSVEINRGARKLAPHAFGATMRSGHYGIFKRAGKKRLPIRELWTSRISDMFRDAIPVTAERGRSVFVSTFMRNIRQDAAR